jgi:indole-3-glycerol phosphate synthase
MNILDQIVLHKKKEIEAAKKKVSIKELANYRHFSAAVPSLKKSLLSHPDFPVIAEFKRQSPSKGLIHEEAKIKEITPAYEKAGVAGISILTDAHFFGGHQLDLCEARDLVKVPLLRKDFIIDPYQVYEAKAIGASTILLIAAILGKAQSNDLAALARELGMEVLMELHSEKEAELLNSYVDMAGINNRNLKTFEVNLEHAANLASILPSDIPAIAESGIHSISDFKFLKEAGFKGFLMGEYFMKQARPGEACQKFKEELTRVQSHLG